MVSALGTSTAVQSHACCWMSCTPAVPSHSNIHTPSPLLMALAGVHLKSGQMLDADLVVDASGRHSDVSKWLEQLGHKPPSTMTVEAGLQYTYRMYEMPEDPDRQWSIAVCIDNPEYNRTAVMVPIETNKWQVQPASKWLPNAVYTFLSCDITAFFSCLFFSSLFSSLLFSFFPPLFFSFLFFSFLFFFSFLLSQLKPSAIHCDCDLCRGMPCHPRKLAGSDVPDDSC